MARCRRTRCDDAIRSWRQQAADPARDVLAPDQLGVVEPVEDGGPPARSPAAIDHRWRRSIVRGRRRQRPPDDDADEIGIRPHDPPAAAASTIACQVGTSTIPRLRSGRSSMSCDRGASTSTAREPLTNTRSGTETWCVADLAGHVGEDGGEDVDRGGEIGRPLPDRRAVVDEHRCAGGASPTGAVRIPNAALMGRWSSLSHRRQRASMAAAVSAVSYSTPTSQPSTSRLIVPAHTGRCAWLPQGSGGRGSTNGPLDVLDLGHVVLVSERGRSRRAGPGPRTRPPPRRRRAPRHRQGGRRSRRARRR